MARRIGRTLSVAVLVLILLALGALAYGRFKTRGTLAIPSSTIANYEAQRVSDIRPAPDFALPSLADRSEEISLADFRGKILVLNFWASWCNPCRLEARDLQAAYLDYRQRGVEFLGVDSRDNDAAGQTFLREFKITYPSVVDEWGELNGDYELLGLPATIVIGRDGRIIFRFIGYLDGPVLRAALDDALARDP